MLAVNLWMEEKQDHLRKTIGAKKTPKNKPNSHAELALEHMKMCYNYNISNLYVVPVSIT